ncbi:MAG TPA: ClpX C4-type zinc finger protein [Ktedonobacteraceae bacterium]|jgi:hypothetical protein|nr:ClpX C4-type zinc finger protein [Ktedonobacteraceae bacterium]
MIADRSLARCSFCGRRPPAVRHLVAGPGAAYICEECLQLCNEILNDPTPFSEKALELASRPPVVVAAPQELLRTETQVEPAQPARTIVLEVEQKQQGMTLLLHQLQLFQEHFELHYLWIRPPLTAGFAFVPRIIFRVTDDKGRQWAGERGGVLLARPELSSAPDLAIYQGSARFRPLPSPDTQSLTIEAADPLGQFENPPTGVWRFEVTLNIM